MSQPEENIEKLNGYLARFRETGILNRVNGKDVPGSAGVFQTITPVDKSVICDVAHGTAEDIDVAAKAAADAFPVMARYACNRTQEDFDQGRRGNRGAGRRNRTLRMLGHGANLALYVEGCASRCRKFPLFCGSGCSGT